MSSLRLSEDNEVWCYLGIETATGHVKSGDQYVAPNEQEKAVFERLGYTSQNLAMLCEAGIKETRVNVLSPTYVKIEVNEDSENRTSLWRASRLINFNDISYLDATVHVIDINCSLRGVPREFPGGMLPEKDKLYQLRRDPPETTLARCYENMLIGIEVTVIAINYTKNKVVGLFRTLTDYLTTK